MSVDGLPVIILVDDDISVLRSLQRLFSLAGYAVREFAGPTEVLAEHPFDGEGCIVTDLRMPDKSGLEFQREALAKGWTLPFVFISGHGELRDAVQAMKAGASDFLEKPLAPQVLLQAVDRALASNRKGRQQRQIEREAHDRIDRLSPREKDVCKLVAKGMLNRQIAARLGTSEKTVKAQRGSAMKKLEARSTADLLKLLSSAGLDW